MSEAISCCCDGGSGAGSGAAENAVDAENPVEGSDEKAEAERSGAGSSSERLPRSPGPGGGSLQRFGTGEPSLADRNVSCTSDSGPVRDSPMSGGGGTAAGLSSNPSESSD